MTERVRAELGIGLAALALAAVVTGKAASPEARLYSSVVPGVRFVLVYAGAKVAMLGLAFAFGAGVVARSGPGPARSAWALLTAGLGLWLVGETIDLAVEPWYLLHGTETPYPGPSDLPYLAGYVPCFLGLAAILRSYRATGLPMASRKALSAVALGALGVLLAILHSSLGALGPNPSIQSLVAAAYPLLDGLLLVQATLLLIVTLPFRGGQVWGVWMTLLAGVLLTAGGDLVFFSVASAWRGQLPTFEGLYILSYATLAIATLRQRALVGTGPAAALA